MSESGDWRSRRWQATHQKIYDAAMRLFHDHGFEQASVAQIAAAAGVSVPTFYAHYPSKEHLVMQLPTAEDMRALVAALPTGLPLRDCVRHASTIWFSTWSPEFRAAQLVRWKLIAGNPSLRTRAAEFERVTAGLLTDALRAERGRTLSPADSVVITAYMAAFTSGVLAWADSSGERKLEELIDEAFNALQQP
ncbi:TetR/AcrR family transcriptional regulator [Blastococcus mobilis]|uniref:TetR/AcrR family transcriptional regulator n=1 Tax=Blastococcus mobilis TaxID=1938746 RepID=UPI000B78E60F|nr:TetR/AcrR family transcriptional regulator [Blastococcus mobilis]